MGKSAVGSFLANSPSVSRYSNFLVPGRRGGGPKKANERLGGGIRWEIWPAFSRNSKIIVVPVIFVHKNTTSKGVRDPRGWPFVGKLQTEGSHGTPPILGLLYYTTIISTVGGGFAQ